MKISVWFVQTVVKLQLGLPMKFLHDHNSIFTLLSLKMRDKTLSQFNDLNLQFGLKIFI